ncbi:MAG TPA: MFS transporter [Candidatus Binataceae bacterium]|nr:MFS transporter [Candidatus Binataceae bacterium]
MNSDTKIADAALATARRKLIPFLFALYVVAYLDRINVGFAALQMNRELGLSESAFGLGAGLFFIGYALFEIPSNLILALVGARIWIARIMLTWGVAAIATSMVRGPISFFVLRFALGAAEAGFFPGVILYLTYWFPAREQARAVALFMMATALAGIVAGPISGAILGMHGLAGISGWQWLFVLEGVPAIALGVAVWLYLPDSPASATWLSEGQREALAAILKTESETAAAHRHRTLDAVLTSPTVWILTVIYFGIVVGLYGVSFWLPRIIQGFGHQGDFTIGLISAIPSLAAAISMITVGRSSDLSGERRWHLAASAFTGAAGLVLAAFSHSPILSLAAISIAAAGIWGTFGPFWAMPPTFLTGTAAAGGIALINSIGNLGGFAGPYVVGIVKQATNSFAGGMLAMAAALTISGVLTLAPRDTAPRR